MWACLFTMITALGLHFPAVTTAAQESGRDAPGTTSALLGGLFVTTSALPIAGFLYLATFTARCGSRGTS